MMNRKEQEVADASLGERKKILLSHVSIDQLFDKLMGRIVAKKVFEEARETPEGPGCLADEELCILYKRNLPKGRMTAVIRHLAECARCLHNYHIIRSDMEEMESITSEPSELTQQEKISMKGQGMRFLEWVKQNQGAEAIDT